MSRCSAMVVVMFLRVVYKALKGVETVAVKFCQSVVSEKDQVRRHRLPCRQYGSFASTAMSCEALRPLALTDAMQTHRR